MSSENSIKPGDTIDIDGTAVTIGARRSLTGLRWVWAAPELDILGTASYTTAQEAVAAATLTLAAGTCRHGQYGWCPSCHDQER